MATYDDIATLNTPLELFLHGHINKMYGGYINNPNLISKIDKEWTEKVEYNERLLKEAQEEEKIKEQKRKELEEFLKS